MQALRVGLIVLLAGGGAFGAGQQSAVQLHVAPRSCHAPCDVVATVTVPRDARNRHLSVVWSYSDSKDWDLGPDSQQAEFTVTIRGLPKGEHTVYAVLMRERDGAKETVQDSAAVAVK